MKKLLKVLTAVVVAAVVFLTGSLYVVYNAEVFWNDNILEIEVFGHVWEFDCYTE